jgi:protein O-mannosyl-transferase
VNISKRSNLIDQSFTNFIYKLILPPIALAITTFLIYFPSLKYPFQFDDNANILKFYDIRHLTFSKLFFSSSRWIIFWLNTINYRLSAFDPFVYRLFNVCFHIIAGILVYYLLYFLLSQIKNKFFNEHSFYIALVTATMFLLHPSQTQTVSYVIQGQLEGLATLFVLITLSLFVCASKRESGILSTFIYSLVFFFAFLASGTKEISIVAPFLILIIDWFFIAQGNVQNLKKRLPFHILFSFFIFGIFIYLMKPQFFLNILGLKIEAKNNIGNLLNSDFNNPITAWQFLISQFKVILHYFSIFIWPFSLCVDYDWRLVENFSDFDCLLPLICVIAIIGFTFYLLKNNKTNLISFGLLWFLICLAPRSSIIPSSEIMADYKTYLASIGLLLLISGFLVFLTQRLKNLLTKKNYQFNQWTNILLIGSFIIILSIGTTQRNYVWSSGYEFWKDVVEKSSEKARACNNFGNELVQKNLYKEAITFFKKAIRLEGKSYADPHVNLANCYCILGKYDLAIESLRKSLVVNQYQPDAYNSLGLILMHQNKYETAEKSFIACLSLVPHHGKALLNLSRTYIQLNEYERAWKCLKNAVTKSDVDNSSLAWEPFAELSLDMEKFDDAIIGFNKLYQLEPTNDHLFKIGVTNYMAKNYKNAVTIFEQLYKLEPFDEKILCNLIECYIKLHNAPSIKKYINFCKENNITYQGIELHEAQLYYFSGSPEISQKIIESFLSKKNNSEDLVKLAHDILKHIKY